MFDLIRCIIDPSRISRLLEYYDVIPNGVSEIKSDGTENPPKDYEIGE